MLRNTSFIKTIMASAKAGFSSPCSGGAGGGGPSVAVILSGCGVNDGSEIHEAVAVLSHLTRNGAKPHCFAPDVKQMHVVDHSISKIQESCRYVLVESARISRGQITDVAKLASKIDDYHAVILPGGFGVAKNLSNFVSEGVKMTVQSDVAEALQAFHKAKKPLGFACISPILAAKLIPCVTITLGKSSGDEWPFKDAIKAAQEMGAKTEEKGVMEVCVDEKNKVFSTPAYMYGEASYSEVDDGIGKMVEKILSSIKK